MNVHVYRNRPDDERTRDELHFCWACMGWYGVAHDNSHCQTGRTATWRPQDCACGGCRVLTGQPIAGSYGFHTDAPEWQP